MSTDSNRMRLWARLLFLKLATLFLRPAQLFSDIAISLRGGLTAIRGWPAIGTPAASLARLEHSLSSCLYRATLFSV
jgi:hypothetical protein